MKKNLTILLILILISITGSAYSQEKIKVEEPKNEMVNDSGEVFIFIEEQPEYPGGDDARLEYLRNEIRYPAEAKKKGIQGTVYATFIVEKDGSITNVKILRGIGGGCDEEVIRVISNMPKWKPAKQRGKNVRAMYNMPIRFILDSNSKTKKQLRKEKREEKNKAKAKRKSNN